MLSLLLVTLGLTAISAYAHPEVRAASDLEVSLSTPADKVASVSDLRVVATVKNTGDKNLKILKFGTVLDDEHHTRSFFVSKDGKEIPFTGIEVCTPPFSALWIVESIDIDGLHRFPPPPTKFPRMAGLSFPPAGM